jgi:hypothetical protein
MAAALEAFLHPGPRGQGEASRPAVRAEDVRVTFVPYATRAPAELNDVLYLDVGADLRPGVIDHHQLHHYPGSTATVLRHRLELLDRCVRPDRGPDDPFTIVLHDDPDLDALGSAYLARAYLATGRLPGWTPVLCQHLDLVDAGHPGFSVRHRFTPYTGFFTLKRRADALGLGSPQQRWAWAVAEGFKMLDHLAAQKPRSVGELTAIDTFGAPGLFAAADRRVLDADCECYQRRLAAPRTHARQASLALPRQEGGGRAEVPALLVRHVQDEGDADACLFFKDWARTDQDRAGGRHPGFVALSVFEGKGKALAEGEVRVPLGRCILSVTPAGGVSLRGLGRLLEQEESRRRLELLGKDHRDRDGQGQARKPRFADLRSPDPWYDGRAHNYTIVDAPAAGSVLTADEIEAVFLRYGKADGSHPLPGG